MRAAERLGHDGIHQVQAAQILGGQSQRLGRRRRLGRVAPEDGGAALRADHGIDGVFQHHHAVCGGQRDGPARTALPDDGRDKGHRRVEPGLDRARDGFRLAARLGLDAGKGAGGVDEGDDRQAEPTGELHDAARLAVALWPRHAEIMLHAAFGIVALFGAEHRNRATPKPPEARHHRRVIRIGAVAGQRRPIGDQGADIVQRLRPFRMAGNQRLLPGRELGIGLAQQGFGLVAKPTDLLGHIDAARIGGPAEFFDLAFELGDRLFEFKEVAHGAVLLAWNAGGRKRWRPRPPSAGGGGRGGGGEAQQAGAESVVEGAAGARSMPRRLFGAVDEQEGAGAAAQFAE